MTLHPEVVEEVYAWVNSEQDPEMRPKLIAAADEWFCEELERQLKA